jgi:hypothetical protein
MASADTPRKPLPKGNTAAVRAVRLHLAGHGFDNRNGIVITARNGVVNVGVMRARFPDAEETARLVVALTALTAKRSLTLAKRAGHLFDTYVYTPEESPVETVETVTIPRAEYDRLRKDSDTLTRLQEAGVDNWEGYDIALRDH